MAPLEGNSMEPSRPSRRKDNSPGNTQSCQWDRGMRCRCKPPHPGMGMLEPISLSAIPKELQGAGALTVALFGFGTKRLPLP